MAPNSLAEESETIAHEVKNYLERWAKQQNFQAWWMTAISVIVGWMLGQFSLHALWPHIF